MADRALQPRRAAPGRVEIVGVRHHSPACAGLAEAIIAELKPATVLIEGPSAFNPHFGELELIERPPVAIFSFLAGAGPTRAGYTPLDVASPEWRAVLAARRAGALALFCDLPFWAGREEGVDAALADRARRLEAALAARLGAPTFEAAWETLIEDAPQEAGPRLRALFGAMRGRGEDDPREAAREAFMARFVWWAQGRGDVALICGGWHVAGVEDALATLERHGAPRERPEPPPPPLGARAEDHLLPFDVARLDAATGYAAGAVSPAYQARLFEAGHEAAADWAEAAICAACKGAGAPIATADRVAWRAQALALSRLRGHAHLLRRDLLDAALSTLVKDTLPGPPAWDDVTARDPLTPILLRALTGEGRGALRSGARRPALVADMTERLVAADLLPGDRRRDIALDRRLAAERAKAQTLHQARLLGLPGLERLDEESEERFVERFRLSRHPDFEAALVEAGRFGPDAPSAAAAALAERIDASPRDAAALTRALADALLAGLTREQGRLSGALRTAILAAPRREDLAEAAATLAQMRRRGAGFGEAVEALAPLAEAAAGRLLALIEAESAAPDVALAVASFAALRDLIADENLSLDRDAMTDALARIAASFEPHAVVAGAAMGALAWLEHPAATPEAVARRLARDGAPDRLGDHLSGLFALARGRVAIEEAPALAAVDALIVAWDDEDFLDALPALRGAFSWFPPREREAIAARVLRRSGLDEASAQAQAALWMRQSFAPRSQADAARREGEALADLARFGLSSLDPPETRHASIV